MKNKPFLIFCTPFLLCLAIIILNIVLNILGYSLSFNMLGLAILCNIICGYSVFKMLKEKYIATKKEQLFLWFSPLFSIIISFYAILKNASLIAVLLLSVLFVCSVVMCLALFNTTAKKIIAGTMGIIAIFIFAPVLLFVSLFGNFGENTVVKSAVSPNGKLRAEVVANSQGALGGDTIVRVYDDVELDLVVFEIKKHPKTVYIGEWGEFDFTQIEWKDDECLIIDEIEYAIN